MQGEPGIVVTGAGVCFSHPLQTISSLCCHRRTASSALIRLQEFSGWPSAPSVRELEDLHWSTPHWSLPLWAVSLKLQAEEVWKSVWYLFLRLESSRRQFAASGRWAALMLSTVSHPCDSEGGGGGSCFPGQISKHS